MRFHDVTHPEDVELSTKLVRDCLQGSILQVGDEGCGFDPGTAGCAGWGLFSIRERAMLLGGEMQVVSAPGKGTCVTLVLPAG